VPISAGETPRRDAAAKAGAKTDTGGH
jgi:hypothetical protein